MIPQQNWGKSLAQLLPKEVWDSVRKEIYKTANYSCMTCGMTGIAVHCHEVWLFDDLKKIQVLRGFQCICPDCHSIKHWGRTVAISNQGKIPRSEVVRLIEHFCEVNKCTEQDFREHLIDARSNWKDRSSKKYKLDWGLFKPETLIKTLEKKQSKRGKF